MAQNLSSDESSFKEHSYKVISREIKHKIRKHGLFQSPSHASATFPLCTKLADFDRDSKSAT